MFTVETRVIGNGTAKVLPRAGTLRQAILVAIQDCSVTGMDVNIWNDDMGKLSSIVKKDRTRFIIVRFMKGIGTTYVLSRDGTIGKKV